MMPNSILYVVFQKKLDSPCISELQKKFVTKFEYLNFDVLKKKQILF